MGVAMRMLFHALLLSLLLALTIVGCSSCSQEAGGSIDAGAEAPCAEPNTCVHRDVCDEHGDLQGGYHCSGVNVCCRLPVPDTGSGDADADVDSDADGDADGDADVDADGDTDTYEAPTCFTSDAGPWEWIELPEGEDCGEGCRQLTFSDTIYEFYWDVYGDYLSFKDEEHRPKIINHSTRALFVLPNIHPEFDFGVGQGMSAFATAMYDLRVSYSLRIYDEPSRSEVIVADLEERTQRVIAVQSEPATRAKYLDSYETVLVGAGGCGTNDDPDLCLFEMDSAECTGVTLISGMYGAHNSMWGDNVVYYVYDNNDIRGYNTSTQQFFSVTSDTHFQLNPRIHGDRVVYQDLRFGDNDGMGNWNHCAVFLYDLETEERTQIAGGEWIAAYPDVHGDIVIWQDYRSCSDPNNKNDLADTEIWGVNLATQVEMQITNLPGRTKAFPRIWGDKIFFQMFKAEEPGTAIYMVEIPSDLLGTK